ncbi:DUF4906 domain-containing protein, partial [uncultured Parabacteroides sp.]
TTFLILATGCDDRFDSRGRHPSGEGKMVDVTLDIGLADEADSYDLSGTPGMSGTASTSSTKSGMDRESAFDFSLVPSQRTKATETSLQPDALYNLEIRQYSSTGTYQGGSSSVEASTAIGTKITLTLKEATHCQLVLVAWGKDNTKRLGTGTLAAAQDVVVEASVIKDLKPDVQADMNKMPYVLHLKDINVSSDGRIYSADGEAIDVRLRLQRLAARLTFNWDYQVSGYTPRQILIHSIPAHYKALASPDKDNTYPSLLDQFTTIQLTNNATTGSYSCWIPANVRGSNPAATSQLYRIKSNAPAGSSYIRFIAVNNTDAKKKLDYRIYLGGKETTDFNLYGNRDYAYQVTFAHTVLPVNDSRVTIVDPIPASQDNNNFVPTANCFMVASGSAFCFDPFKYQVDGKDNENATLKGWSDSEGGIASVKVLWQTLEDGDVGDPVLGVANSDGDHTNIVDIVKNDGTAVSASSPLTAKDQGRIYCRIAPNTTGGSGAIAAYNSSGRILWSWHIWVTDYNPDATGTASVYEPANKRKQLYVSSSNRNAFPMMDRNLGAFIGLDRAPKDRLEMTKANGFHYQRGRKDPYSGTYTTSDDKDFSAVITPGIPPKNFLNRYEGNGLSWLIPENKGVYSSLRDAYATPLSIASSGGNQQWCSEQTAGWNSSSKGIHDPCPAGWRIPQQNTVYQPLIDNNQSSGSYNDVAKNGGVLLRYENNSEKVTYIRYAGYVVSSTSVINVGAYGYLNAGTPNQIFQLGLSGTTPNFILTTKWNTDVHTVRCMQERAN